MILKGISIMKPYKGIRVFLLALKYTTTTCDAEEKNNKNKEILI